MGASIVVEGYKFPLRTYSLEEDSTPLSASDSTGGTGLLTFTISAPDPNLEYWPGQGMHWVKTMGPNILQGKSVVFEDSNWGTIEGQVSSVQRTDPSAIRVTATTTLATLNAFNVQSQPFSGTLGGLIGYYVSLSGFPGGVVVDPFLASRPVAVPGWTGELWYHLKMLAQAHEFEITLRDGDVVFEQLRQRSIRTGRERSAGGEVPVPTLAQSVEVYQYNNRPITNELVYPPGGWTPEVSVMNVNAGETTPYTLELSASVSSIQQPTMLTFVPPSHSSSSVFTVVANDGLPVSPAAWEQHGGKVEVSINPDTHRLDVVLTGATGLPTSMGTAATNFSIALGSDVTGSRYSTFRIVGTGVAYDKQKKTFKTGITANQTGTEVGVSIDNPFLSNKTQTYRAGSRAAADFAGPVPSAGAEVISVGSGPAIGRVPGSRLFDKQTARYWRVRQTSYGPSGISVTHDDDLLFSDFEALAINMTYGEVQTQTDGLTYQDDYLRGLRLTPPVGP